MPVDALLLSSSSLYGHEPFAFAREELREFLSGGRVAFIPYAVTDHDAYTQRMAQRLAPYGCTVTGVQAAAHPMDGLRGADIVYVGGGNTFRLLKAVRALGLLDEIREAVTSGRMRYMGSSAGANLATPTIKTTNDMPIVEPGSFDALHLVDFQINAHFIEADPNSTHMGETREQRIAEFHEENATPVVGLREGAFLRARNGRVTLGGMTGAIVFRRDQAPLRAETGADLTEILRP